MKCRMCKTEKQIIDFTKRFEKITKTCIECSNKRAVRDYCEHGTRNHDCVQCRDPIDRRVHMMLKHKHTDRVKNRENDLTFENLMDLIEKCGDQCCYCGCGLQHETRNDPNYSSIERIHNSIGHTISNCLITCLECNISRRGDLIWGH